MWYRVANLVGLELTGDAVRWTADETNQTKRQVTIEDDCRTPKEMHEMRRNEDAHRVLLGKQGPRKEQGVHFAVQSLRVG